MTPQKFCFRYDGSDEAKEAFCIWDRIKDPLAKSPALGFYYLLNGEYDNEAQTDYTLVPPSEFIRLMKGERVKFPMGTIIEDDMLEGCKIGSLGNTQTWQPNSEAMCRINGKEEKVRILATNKKYAWVDRHDDNAFTVNLYELRPIRKSVRDEVSDVLYQILRYSGLEKNLYKSEYPDQTVYPDINPYTDRIIQLIKERGVEG